MRSPIFLMRWKYAGKHHFSPQRTQRAQRRKKDIKK
jgi:hypothetical protein